MKKIIYKVISVLMIIAMFAGCSATTEASAPNSSADTITENSNTIQEPPESQQQPIDNAAETADNPSNTDEQKQQYTKEKFGFHVNSKLYKDPIVIEATIPSKWTLPEIPDEGYYVSTTLIGKSTLSFIANVFDGTIPDFVGELYKIGNKDFYLKTEMGVHPSGVNGPSDFSWDWYCYSYIDEEKQLIYSISICNAGEFTVDEMEAFASSFIF